jgi:hypothetical protein
MDVEHLHASVDRFRDALASIPPGHPQLPQCQFSLANALRVRCLVLDQPRDLDEAIALGHELIAGLPATELLRHVYLSDLAEAVQERFARTEHLTHLGNALRTRYGRTGLLPDLDEAIDRTREAVVTAARNDPDTALYRSNLAGVLAERFSRTGVQRDLDEATTVGREVIA